MSCEHCFSDFIVKCPTELRVFAKLPALGPYDSYQWVITDKFEARYSGDITPDANDFFTIPITDLPDGLLTQYSGSFILEVVNQDGETIDFTIAQKADCISFDVKPGNFVKDNLGIEF